MSCIYSYFTTLLRLILADVLFNIVIAVYFLLLLNVLRYSSRKGDKWCLLLKQLPKSKTANINVCHIPFLLKTTVRL